MTPTEPTDALRPSKSRASLLLSPGQFLSFASLELFNNAIIEVAAPGDQTSPLDLSFTEPKRRAAALTRHGADKAAPTQLAASSHAASQSGDQTLLLMGAGDGLKGVGGLRFPTKTARSLPLPLNPALPPAPLQQHPKAPKPPASSTPTAARASSPRCLQDTAQLPKSAPPRV